MGKTQIHRTSRTSGAEQRSRMSEPLRRNHLILQQGGWHFCISNNNRERPRANCVGHMSTGQVEGMTEPWQSHGRAAGHKHFSINMSD